MNTHFAKLTGLKPDQVNDFIIKDSEGIGNRYWFRTAPDKPQPFTFILQTKQMNMLLRIDNEYLAVDRKKVDLHPVPIKLDQWYDIKLQLN